MVPDPKPIRYRNDKYLDYIRAMPCWGCGLPGPSDPHHVSIDGQTMGGKPSDQWTVPLCRKCHRREEDGPWISKEDLYREICKLLGKWIRDGEK